jgi:tetratricopeptide (TPR) repeat protein
MSVVTRALKISMVVALGMLFNLLPSIAKESALPTPALNNWKAAATTFEKTGELIAQGDYQQAKADLITAGATLPANYSTLAMEFLTRLESAVSLSTNLNDPARIESLIELCTSLGAHKAALQMESRRTVPSESLDEGLHAWRLFESGNAEASLKVYQRKLAKEIVDIWQDYYREQIRLIANRPANLTNASFSIDLVKHRYLKGLETQADLFGALKELTRVLAYATDAKAAVPVYQLILKCLSGLGDEAGREAWQDSLLVNFKSDPEVCAAVYCDRGKKAYARKDIKSSQEWFQKVCSDFPDSNAYGDAQYGLGLVLQEQQKCDEAIPEYEKLFASKVNDHALDPDNSQDCANYRFKAALRISECYEGRKDFAKALEYATRARDRYPFMSFCKDCLRDTRRNVEKRVQLLQEKAKARPASD